MKILFITTRSCLGGAQSVVMNLANRLCENNDVAVAAGIDDGEDASILWSLLSPSVCQYKIKSLVKKISPSKDIKAACEIRRIYNEFKPDVVHLHSSKASVIGRMVLPANKIIYTVHGFDTIRVANRKFLPIERILQYRCRFIVGVSNYDYKNLESERINNHVSVIYNGLSVPIIDKEKEQTLFSNEKKNILSIARVSPPKRHDLFIQIAQQLPEYNFVWIGNLDPIEGTPDNCHFVGNIPNAGAYCNDADLFVLVSDYEGLPMTIIEAMSQGLPVISSNVGGVHEIVQNGVNGFVVPNEVNDFTDKIKTILENAELYSKMSQSSKSIYEKDLTVDNMVSKYFELYCAIADN